MYIAGLLFFGLSLPSFVYTAIQVLPSNGVFIEDGSDSDDENSGHDKDGEVELEAEKINQDQRMSSDERRNPSLDNVPALVAVLSREVVFGDDKEGSKRTLKMLLEEAAQVGLCLAPLAKQVIEQAQEEQQQRGVKYGIALGIAAEGSKFLVRPVCSGLAVCAEKTFPTHFYLNVVVSKLIYWFGLGSPRLFRQKAEDKEAFELGQRSVGAASDLYRQYQQREQ